MKPSLKSVLVAVVSFVAGAVALAMFQHNRPAGYAGLETREIKALSAEDLAGLKEGKGLGYALAAELNGYPGPRHVLELADKLALSGNQKQKTEQLFAEMKAEASALGEKLIAAERSLDRGFMNRALDPQALENLTGEAAAFDGKLRATHLRYHLAMMDVLTPEQIQDYVKLRGYAGGHSGH